MSVDKMNSLKTPEQIAFARALQSKFMLKEGPSVELTHTLVLLQDEHQLLTEVISEHGLSAARERALRVIAKALPLALADHIPDTQGLGWSARRDGQLVLMHEKDFLEIPHGDGSVDLYAKLRARYEAMRSPGENQHPVDLRFQVAALPPEQQVALLSPEAVSLVQSGQQRSTADLALQAIKARFDGVFDDPALIACGALSPSAQDDVQWILAHHADVFRDFDRASFAAPIADEDPDHVIS